MFKQIDLDWMQDLALDSVDLPSLHSETTGLLCVCAFQRTSNGV
jgi:hypothetical protein